MAATSRLQASSWTSAAAPDLRQAGIGVRAIADRRRSGVGRGLTVTRAVGGTGLSAHELAVFPPVENQ
jgi:hypothetical protein